MNNKIKLGFEQFQKFVTDEFDSKEKNDQEVIDNLRKDLEIVQKRYDNIKATTISPKYKEAETTYFKYMEALERLRDEKLIAKNSLENVQKELSVVRDNYECLSNSYNTLKINKNALKSSLAQRDSFIEKLQKVYDNRNKNVIDLVKENNKLAEVNKQLINFINTLGYKVTIVPVDNSVNISDSKRENLKDLIKKGLSNKYHVEEVKDSSMNECSNGLKVINFSSAPTSIKRDSNGRFAKK